MMRPAPQRRNARTVLSAIWVSAAALWGCAPDRSAPPTADSDKRMSAAIVTDAGGIDDRSFNAAAWEGLERAKAELGIDARYLESREQSDYKTNLASLADQGHDVVFAIGYLMEDALKEVAPRYPATRFVIIDGSAPELDNCLSVKFREEEGAFLVGFLAASVSKTGVLAFIGGMEGPLMKRFEVGYRSGARSANAQTRVLVKHIGNWTDMPKGKELARSAIQQGADIIFAAAGKGGLGALDAAAEAGPGVYGVGVDKDQDDLHPGRVLSSMMKGVDVAVFDAVASLKKGQWKAGTLVLGVREGGLKLSPMRFTRKSVPEPVMRRVGEIRKLIAEGQLQVPKTEEELRSFVPPAL